MVCAVVARGIAKSYSVGHGEAKSLVSVLQGVDLEISLGEMVAIVGPSGSGKSTLLYCLSGLEKPDRGHVEIMGSRVTGATRRATARIRRDHVGFVFQDYNLIPSLSAMDNIVMPSRLVGKRVPQQRLNSVVASLGLMDCKRRSPEELSGGERQRVAIARALVGDAAVVFADEPTGALDSQNGKEVLKMMRRIGDDPRRAVVMVTHDLEAASCCDRVFVLKDGAVVNVLGRSLPSQILEALECAE